MLQKPLSSRAKARPLSVLGMFCSYLILSILSANCNKQAHPSGEKINWLDHWDPIVFKSDVRDKVKVDSEMKRIRVYVRGWLADYNNSIGKPKRYIVKDVHADTVSTSPLTFKFTAYLKPSAKRVTHPTGHPSGPGGHLIPSEPPPPE